MRYHATAEGNIPFTAEEELEADQRESEWNAQAKTRLKARVTSKREQVERGGTIIKGVLVKADASLQARLTGTLNFVSRNPGRPIKWKSANGDFATLNKIDIEKLSDAVGEFIAKCFDAEAAHYAAIDALTTPEQVSSYNIETGWPA